MITKPLAVPGSSKENSDSFPTYGQHKGVKLMGTVDYETSAIFLIEE